MTGLDKRAVTFPPQGVGAAPAKPGKTDHARRRMRFELRETAAKLLGDQIVARCGRHVGWKSHDHEQGFASIKIDAKGRARWSGTVTCGSVWHCPYCAAKIAAGRRDEVRKVIDGHQAGGGVIYMATFTMPHHAFQHCRTTREAVSKSFTKVIQGREWMQAKAALGVEMIRALEVTHGVNGWHPHLHVLVLLPAAAADHADYLSKFLFRRWSRIIERSKFGRCSPDAWQFERCRTPDEAGDYVAKWGPDWELTHAHLKDAKAGGRSPWRILRDYAERGDARDAELFREYALAFKGARQLTWSHGLKAKHGVGEVDDETLAASEDRKARTLVKVHEDVLRLLMRKRLAARALEIAETEGAEGLARFFKVLGIDGASWQLVETAPDPPPRDGPPLSDQEALAKIFGLPAAHFSAGAS